MGLGIGIDCERCGQQLAYDQREMFDEERKLCGDCVSELRKKKWDREENERIRLAGSSSYFIIEDKNK